MKMLHIRTVEYKPISSQKDSYNLQICLLERLKIKEPSRQLKKLGKETAGYVQRKQRKK